MGRLNIRLPDDLEEQFRKEVGKRFGAKKGSLNEAFKEAVELWIAKAKK